MITYDQEQHHDLETKNDAQACKRRHLDSLIDSRMPALWTFSHHGPLSTEEEGADQ